MVTGRPIVYRGRKEICAAVGVPYSEIATFVRDYKLPAFKINGNGGWVALPEDLEKWIRDQRDQYLQQ